METYTSPDESAQSRRIPWILLGLVGLLIGLPLAGAALIGCVALGLYLVILNPAATAGGSPVGVGWNSRPTTGEPAPDFTAAMLDGTTTSLSDTRGTLVAVNFWTTWCPDCQLEMPVLQAADERYANDELVILGVDVEEPPTAVESYIQPHGYTFPILLDPSGQIAASYGVWAFPTTVWIDADGVIRAIHIGGMDENVIDSYVRQFGGQ
jgi:peroxiredoxin